MTEEQRVNILEEVVRTFGKQEWFRNATIFDQHPMSGEPTIEIKVNYVPLFERKSVKEFALKFNLAERFIVVDRNGNPAE